MGLVVHLSLIAVPAWATRELWRWGLIAMGMLFIAHSLFTKDMRMRDSRSLYCWGRRCLLEKGYARTTTRDIAAAAGVSLAAIGYHFSSKEALLTEALMLAIGDWDKGFRNALISAVRADADPAERFEATWERLIETFETHRRLWVANSELFAQLDRLPENSPRPGRDYSAGTCRIAALFLNKEESAIDEQTARTAGAFYHALLSGLISQFLINPEHALSAHDLTDALCTSAAGMLPTHKPSKTKSKRTQEEIDEEIKEQIAAAEGFRTSSRGSEVGIAKHDYGKARSLVLGAAPLAGALRYRYALAR